MCLTFDKAEIQRVVTVGSMPGLLFFSPSVVSMGWGVPTWPDAMVLLKKGCLPVAKGFTNGGTAGGGMTVLSGDGWASGTGSTILKRCDLARLGDVRAEDL